MLRTRRLGFRSRPCSRLLTAVPACALLAFAGCAGSEPESAATISRSAHVASIRTAVAAASPATPAPAGAPINEPLSGRVITLDPGHNGGNFTHPVQIGRLVNDGNGEKECDTPAPRRRTDTARPTSTGASRSGCERCCSRPERMW